MPGRSLHYLPGVGPARAAKLAELGLHDTHDLLYRVPRLGPAAPPEHSTGPLPPGVAVQVRLRLTRIGPPVRRRGVPFHVYGETADGRPVTVRFFNAGYLRDHLHVGEWYRFNGGTDTKRGDTLNHPRFVHLPGGALDPTPPEQGIRVSYGSLADAVGERTLLHLLAAALEDDLPQLQDPAGALADTTWQRHILALHRPGSAQEHEAARTAFAERELLALAWALQERRAQFTAGSGFAWRWTDHIHQRALARLPFTPTDQQHAAMATIRCDAQSPRPMYRLLQGDVGTGKTACALVTALAVVADRAQVLLMAPTAVVASQHHRFIEDCLAGTRLVCGLLTGSTPSAERQALLARFATGDCHLLVGTHALLEPAVRPARLGLVIIDEQHKFGVEQRRALLAKAGHQREQPDLLLLTATPIPRTLALSAFGDLALTRIDERPPGRQAVTTAVQPHRLQAVIDTVAAALEDGGSAFVVAPLKRASDQIQASDAAGLAQRLSERLGQERVALITGDDSDAQKEAALAAFREGRRPVLVGTTVIEVGIDVPRATLMVVCDADRFGLAQLHQLRGRLGRGTRAGHCLLTSRRDAGLERLRILEAHDDGQAVAEADLAMRGPGELLGHRQHGLPDLRCADPLRDGAALAAAHERAQRALATGQSMPPGLRDLLPSTWRGARGAD